MRTWHHIRTSSDNTRRCICEFLSVIFVLNGFACCCSKSKFCYHLKNLFNPSYMKLRDFYLNLRDFGDKSSVWKAAIYSLCMWSSLWVCDAPSGLHRYLIFSYLSALNLLISMCGSLPPLIDGMIANAGGVHVHIYMVLMGEEYVCVVVMTYSPAHLPCCQIY